MWRMVDSEYAADPSKTWSKTYIGDENWVSYSVEFEASYGRGYGYDQDIALIVRAQGEKEMWIIMDCDDTDFYLNGSSDPIAHKDAGLRPCDSSKKKVKVEVQGNIYKVYVDGSSIFTVQDSTLERGRVGLAVKNSHERTPRFDNFKIIALE
ncbi:MAG: hypothetical protein DPW09_41740 [Anaerolineae bacterium]|nr:hypothetical protein [Anaerolineae bacterium]